MTDKQNFQTRVNEWMMACFGLKISMDRVERGDRLLEELLELLQSGGYDRERIYALVEYVYGRPVGEPEQEAGSVMVTMAAYCQAHGIDMDAAGAGELARVWTKVDAIREKQAKKPTGSALPAEHLMPMAEASDEVASFIAGASGLVEATTNERHQIWSRNNASNICTWVENNSGYGVQVGSLAGRPVCISINKAKLDGQDVIFWHATSEAVDYRLINGWWERNAPDTARDGFGNIRTADASNWTHVLPRGRS